MPAKTWRSLFHPMETSKPQVSSELTQWRQLASLLRYWWTTQWNSLSHSPAELSSSTQAICASSTLWAMFSLYSLPVSWRVVSLQPHSENCCIRADLQRYTWPQATVGSTHTNFRKRTRSSTIAGICPCRIRPGSRKAALFKSGSRNYTMEFTIQ